jgi:hypothetical protein
MKYRAQQSAVNLDTAVVANEAQFAELVHEMTDPRSGAVASGRLSPPLAVEIALAGRAPANRVRTTYADPADEYGEFALGGAARPRRTAQAWV